MSHGNIPVKDVSIRYLSWLKNHGQSLLCETCHIEFKEHDSLVTRRNGGKNGRKRHHKVCWESLFH